MQETISKLKKKMDFSYILIIFGIIFVLITYFGIQESEQDDKMDFSRDEKIPIENNKKLQKPNMGTDKMANILKNDKDSKIKEDSITPQSPEYFILTKTKNELTQSDYQALENQYNQILYKRGAEPFHQSLKENSRIFIAYDKSTGLPVGQAAILILDTHDFWGAFSKIRNLNLDAQSVILYNVCVIPEHRRRGIAEQILQSIHLWSFSHNKPNIVLFVDPTNQSAIRLYERMGYSVDKSHYAPNGAEIMMRLKLH